jgi:hypothetical protein
MKKLLRTPIIWGILAALLVAVPQLQFYKFFGTDCTHIGILEGTLDYPGMGPLALYQFSDGSLEHMNEIISEGFYPWFTNPRWKMNFCRHIPSGLMAMTHGVFGQTAIAYPIHSLLWYLIIIVFLGLLVRRILPGTGGWVNHPAAYMVLVIFAFSTRNAEILFYGGARWLLVATAFVLAGFLAHLKWREENWKPGRFLSLAAFLAALLSGEASLAVLAFLAAYELFGSADPLKIRIKALLPTSIMVFVYLIIYRLMGYGGGGMDLYTHPFSDPVGFITALPVKLTSMIGEMLFGIISVLKINTESHANEMQTILIGLAVLLICGLLFFPVWSKAGREQRRKYNWLIIGLFAGMLPLASVSQCSRVVLIPSLGGSILLAAIFHHWWQRIRQKPKSLAWIGGLAGLVLFGLHMVLSPYFWFVGGKEFDDFLVTFDKYHKETVLNEIQPHQKAVFLNGTGGGADIIFSGYYYRKSKGLPMPESWWPLAFSNIKGSYHRTNDNTLVLEVSEGSVYGTSPVFLVRKLESPLIKGDVIKLKGLHIKVLEVNQTGPTQVEFKFDLSLDDNSFRFYKLHEGKLQSIKPPPQGESITL